MITDSINIFLRKSIMQGGLSFEMRQPRYNIEIEVALNETRAKTLFFCTCLFDKLDTEKDGE